MSKHVLPSHYIWMWQQYLNCIFKSFFLILFVHDLVLWIQPLVYSNVQVSVVAISVIFQIFGSVKNSWMFERRLCRNDKTFPKAFEIGFVAVEFCKFWYKVDFQEPLVAGVRFEWLIGMCTLIHFYFLVIKTQDIWHFCTF